MRLHEARKHEHVIAAIEAALRHGQSQPWMYEVLALSMEITGRPQADIERVLLSQVDFTAADLPSMMYSAAYLSRMDGDRQALRLYRQASQIAPLQPEPYILGLKLARKLNDAAGVQWAAAGILQYAWGGDSARLHRDAEDAALNAAQSLLKEGKRQEAAELNDAIAQARQRDLVLELTWSGDGDLDLVVEEPLGTICSVENPRTAGGGVLLHDGYGPKQENCHENYVCPLAVPGDYRVTVKHVRGNIVGKRASLKIVRYQGTPGEIERTVTVPIEDPGKVVRLSLNEGRRRGIRNSELGTRNSENSLLPYSPLLTPRSALRNPRSAFPTDPQSRAALASFSESRQTPFVTGVAPGAGGVGFQPIISVIPEGTALAAMAVVSADRRYVRLNLSPLFSRITGVDTFTFQGTPQTSGQTGGQAGPPAGPPAGTP